MPSATARALASPAREWLALWTRLFGVDGFNPFDTLAVAYAISSKGFGCERLPARIETLPDDVTEPGVQGVRVDRKPYLLASQDLAGAAERHIGVPADLTREVLASAGAGPSTIADPTALLARYIGAVERLWELVDTWKRA